MTNRSLLASLLGVAVAGTLALAQPKSITILHTNDMHAGFVPHEAFWVRSTPKPMVGGFAELAAAVDSIRALRPVLILDAGDVMTGNPITEMTWAGAYGGALFEMMNRIGYEAWTPGNHDFDVSAGNLLTLSHIARFPTVSANLRTDAGELLTKTPWVILGKNGLRIGVIGWMSRAYYSLVNVNSSKGIHLDTAMATMQALVDELRPKTDLLIALTHQGTDDDSLMAMRVHGIDLIVGGHSHTRLKKPVHVNGVVIVQTGANAENLGVLDLSVENHKILQADGELHQLWVNGTRPKTALTSFIDSLQTSIDAEYAKVIGMLKSDWKRGDGETGIGNFLADAQREGARADVGFMNNGGIRKDVPAGPLTKRALFEVLPFRNILVSFDLTGAQIRMIVEHAIALQAKGREPIQTSGIIARWKRDASGAPVVLSIQVNGAPLDEKKTYRGAASDYFMGEAPRYLGIPTPKLEDRNQTVFEVMETKVRAMQTIDSKVENRIQEVKD
jgi:5'-nucleotidase / UDP-sugar diphosphatase